MQKTTIVKLFSVIPPTSTLSEFGGNNTTTYSPDIDPLLAGRLAGINSPACEEEEVGGEERWPMEINSLEPVAPIPKKNIFARVSMVRGKEMEAA